MIFYKPYKIFLYICKLYMEFVGPWVGKGLKTVIESNDSIDTSELEVRVEVTEISKNNYKLSVGNLEGRELFSLFGYYNNKTKSIDTPSHVGNGFSTTYYKDKCVVIHSFCYYDSKKFQKVSGNVTLVRPPRC